MKMPVLSTAIRGCRHGAVLDGVRSSATEAVDASSAPKNASWGSASTLAVEARREIARLLVVLELHPRSSFASASSSLLVRGSSAFSRFADCCELLF